MGKGIKRHRSRDYRALVSVVVGALADVSASPSAGLGRLRLRRRGSGATRGIGRSSKSSATFVAAWKAWESKELIPN